jgi:GNAT superfamily N-acetyltransferase
MNIRPSLESDFPALWRIFQQVVAPGDSYVFAPDSSAQTAHAYWFGPGVSCFVAEDDGGVIGMYKLIPNQRDLGAHVANASFMVSPERAGQGTGQHMGRHCLQEAKRAGYLAIQFNFVVSTNKAAVSLWQKLGFAIVGTLPKVFRHQSLGYVDAYVMHRFLDDIRV